MHGSDGAREGTPGAGTAERAEGAGDGRSPGQFAFDLGQGGGRRTVDAPVGRVLSGGKGGVTCDRWL